MRAMPDPFEPSDTPRLLTPQELAMIVRISRFWRGWSQEALAATANVATRTIQRVERGDPSDTTTRQALARAFGVNDFDVFNTPTEFLSLEQMAEKRRKEDEERYRDFIELPLSRADGIALIELAMRTNAFSLGRASDVECTRPHRERVQCR
jgi:transcriptional regulator with XRE-family HTH domain